MVAFNRQNRASCVSFERPLEARLISDGGAFICECLVLELSEKHARLKIAAPVAHPEEFFLLLSTFGRPVYRRCVRDWSEGMLLGVSLCNERVKLRSLDQPVQDETHIS